MSGPVFRTYYEVAAEALPICAAHYAAELERNDAGMKLAEAFGAMGFRRNNGKTGIRHLIFRSGDAPAGWKYSQREVGGLVACVPDKRTATGKLAVTALAAFENAPTAEDLASELGYRVASAPMDGFKIYWPTAYRFLFPVERHFLDIPRQADDGWEPPAHLIEVPASTFMLAMEGHNAEARAQREVAA